MVPAFDEWSENFRQYNPNNYFFPQKDFYKALNIDPQAASSSVVPSAGSHIQEYADFQNYVSENEDPWLTAVVNAPCSYLWCWLGTILPNFATNIGMNVYIDTIGNLLGKELNAKMCTPGLVSNVNTLGMDKDLTKAVMIFKMAMLYEMENFNSTTSSHWV